MKFQPPKIHTIQITVDEELYKKAKKKKGKKSWTEFLYETVRK